MSRWSERVFFIGLALVVLGLAAVDAGLGGRERPLLVLLLLGGILVLWLLTRRGSLAPEGWRRGRSDGDDPQDIDRA